MKGAISLAGLRLQVKLAPLPLKLIGCLTLAFNSAIIIQYVFSMQNQIAMGLKWSIKLSNICSLFGVMPYRLHTTHFPCATPSSTAKTGVVGGRCLSAASLARRPAWRAAQGSP